MCRYFGVVFSLALFIPLAGCSPKPKDESKFPVYFPTTVGDKRV
jgi:hypothetical protein